MFLLGLDWIGARCGSADEPAWDLTLAAVSAHFLRWSHGRSFTQSFWRSDAVFCEAYFRSGLSPALRKAARALVQSEPALINYALDFQNIVSCIYFGYKQGKSTCTCDYVLVCVLIVFFVRFFVIVVRVL